jgi:hypothetical protein
MRLLNTDSVEIRQFGDADIPPYAILSHRWSEEKVTFQDIAGAHAAQKGDMKKSKTAAQ